MSRDVEGRPTGEEQEAKGPLRGLQTHLFRRWQLRGRLSPLVEREIKWMERKQASFKGTQRVQLGRRGDLVQGT